jgi:hypothetical protein
MKNLIICFYLIGLFILFNPVNEIMAKENVCNPTAFNLSLDFSAGRALTDVSKNDFDGDGVIDIAVSSRTNDVFSILKGDGDGGFFPPKSFFIEGFVANKIASGDFNSDNRKDVIVGNASANILAVFLNDGQGGFSDPSIIVPEEFTGGIYDLEVGDFNGDTFLDFVSINHQQNRELRIFLGDGQGNFTPNIVIPLNADESKVAVGNLNNDSTDDLVVYSDNNSSGKRISFIFGSLPGNFSLQFGFSVSERVTGIEITNLNSDSLNDLAISFLDTTQPLDHSLQPWFNNGGTSFTAGTKVSLPHSLPPTDITTADFNGDGFIDLAAPIGNIANVVITTYGDGNGNFNNLDYRTVPNGSNIIFSADLNQNNKQDIGVLRTPSELGGFASILLNDNNNGFKAPTALLFGTSHIAAADFNNDNFNDFTSGVATSGQTSEVVIALNDTLGGFLPDQNFPTPFSVKSYSVGDFNGDNNIDAVTIHGGSFPRDIHVYLGDGTGVIGAPIETDLEINFDQALLVGEFNSDNRDDIVAIATNGDLYVLLSNGDGTFSVSPNYPISIGTTFTTFTSGDYNNDTKLDFVVAENSETAIWLGDGTGQFSRSVFLNSSLPGLLTGDFNGDNNLDMAAFGAGNIRAFYGDGQANFTESTIDPPNISQSKLIVGDFNVDGFDDLAYTTTFPLWNLIVLPSLGASNSFADPLRFSFGGNVSGFAQFPDIITADFNNDNKIDIGYASAFRSVILNKSGELPCLSIADTSVNEGSSVGNSTAVFTVTLSSVANENVRVNYSIEGDSASVDADFESVSGRLLIPAGQISATIEVPISDDSIDEFDEEFIVNLSSPANAAISDNKGVGTIIDDDAAPTVTISDFTGSEATGGQNFVFTVGINGQSEKPLSFRYMTANGTATGEPGNTQDYFPDNRVINVQAGQVSVNIFISVRRENTFELDENFFVNISEAQNLTIVDNQAEGEILNDDSIPNINLVGSATVEGDSGITNTTINLQLSNPTYLPITLDLTTSDISAVAGEDYIELDGNFTIPAEETTPGLQYQIIGDTINEPTESFNLTVSNVQNANVGTSSAQIFILDDESATNDFDGDGRTDISIFRPSLGQWWYLQSSDFDNRTFAFGNNNDTLVPADFTGDSKTDIAFWRESTGEWFVLRSEDSSFYSVPFGTTGDIPAPGDFDGDGMADTAVFRPSTATWFIQNSSGGTTIVPFGIPEDKPVIADYDGDGKDDIAVYRPSLKQWWLNRSTDGVLAYEFGAAGDKTVQGDYTGDGKADSAIFRPSTGEWFVIRSEDLSFYSVPFGISTDIPTPGDYDGDGKFDTAVFRPTDNNWYVQGSTSGFFQIGFGTAGDIPIPNVYSVQ